jgi:parvulin-like peptidyl-prolyl isomerase
MKTLNHLLLLGSMFFLGGCEPPPPPDGPNAVVARVNNTRLTVGDLDSDVQTALLPTATAQMKQDWVKQWVQAELLAQEAVRQDLHNDKKIARELVNIRRDFLAEVMLEKILHGQSPDVSDQALKAYYNTHPSEFIRQASELKLGVIVLQNESTAREAWRQLIRSRLSFEEMARTQSIHSSAQQEGDLGFLKKTDISDPTVKELVFSMRVGEISKPVHTEAGYFIFKVADQHELGTVRVFSDVRNEIVNKVLQDRRRNQIKQLVEGLRQQAEVEINHQNLIQDENQVPKALSPDSNP